MQSIWGLPKIGDPILVPQIVGSILKDPKNIFGNSHLETQVPKFSKSFNRTARNAGGLMHLMYIGLIGFRGLGFRFCMV